MMRLWWGVGVQTPSLVPWFALWRIWDLNSEGFLHRVLFLRGMCPCGPVSLPPLEWFQFPSLVAAVLITPKGAESSGSGRIGVIGALVFLSHMRPSTINCTFPGRPSIALRYWDVVEYSEVADSVHARTWSNEKMADMDSLRYSPDDPYYRLGPVHTCLYVRACRLVSGTSS